MPELALRGTLAIWTLIGELILLQGDYLLNSLCIQPVKRSERAKKGNKRESECRSHVAWKVSSYSNPERECLSSSDR